MYAELTESERFPLLTPPGRKLLHAMRQDPQAPLWNWPNGEQLDVEGLARVNAFASALTTTPATSRQEPPWLAEFVDYCLAEVPHYRQRSAAGTPLASIPSTTRADLTAKVWGFVPESQPLDDLIVFSSSGTTGHPAQLPTSSAAAACGVVLLERALASVGLQFPRGPAGVALSNVVAYRGAYTTAIVVAYLQEAGCVRVNLSSDAWRNVDDRRAYMDRWAAPVMLGDPVAFAQLAAVGIERPPQAMISCITHLSDALAANLTEQYGCPVLDLYALTEAGIVGLKTPHGFAILPHDLYVEILDEHDQPCPVGMRGEITLTGGRNPYLPLLRYRTGDFAAWAWHDGQAVLADLEGRQPVQFVTPGDRIVHSMEVTRLLRRFPLTQYQLHQDADGSFHFRYRGFLSSDDLQSALLDLLGPSTQLQLSELPDQSTSPRKWVAYSSDMKW